MHSLCSTSGKGQPRGWSKTCSCHLTVRASFFSSECSINSRWSIKELSRSFRGWVCKDGARMVCGLIRAHQIVFWWLFASVISYMEYSLSLEGVVQCAVDRSRRRPGLIRQLWWICPGPEFSVAGLVRTCSCFSCLIPTGIPPNGKFPIEKVHF